MTNKRNRFYQIGFIISTMICIGLLAFMGITAIQKSMTLKLGFQSSPQVLCELQVDGIPIFDNTTQKVAEYVELSGNTLMFDKDRHTSVFGAETFQLTLKNYAQTESQLLVKFENATVNGGNEVFILDNLAHNFTVTPTENLVSISMARVLKVDIEKTGVVLSNSNLTNISGDSYYLNLDENNNLSATFSLASGYKEPISISATTSKDTYTSSTGSITIPSENLGTGNISITASAVENIATISYATMTNCSSSVNIPTIQIGELYETTITADANNGYILDSVTVDGLDSSEYTITKTTSQEWTLSIPSVSKGFSISATARLPRLTVVYGGDGGPSDAKGREMSIILDASVSANQASGFFFYPVVSGGELLGEQPSGGYEILIGRKVSIYSYASTTREGDISTFYYYTFTVTGNVSLTEVDGGNTNTKEFYMPAYDVALTITTDAVSYIFDWADSPF